MLDCNSIDLSENKIEKVESDFFVDHQKLEVLILDHNYLRRLPQGIFHGLVNLANLKIKHNWLEVLDDDLLMFNAKLKYFDVSSNNLMKVSPMMFDSNSALRVASFIDNFCIDSAYPAVPLCELKNQIDDHCGEKDLLSVLTNLVRVSWKFRDATSDSIINVKATPPPDINESSTAVTATSQSQNNMDRLILKLFWLIIPIIAILSVLLTIVGYAIYKKYFVYRVNAPRTSIL